MATLQVVWQHRTWGEAPDPKYPWAATFYGDKGTLKASVMSYDFIPTGGGQPIHRDVTYELDQYPEDRTEKTLKNTAPRPRAGTCAIFSPASPSRGRPVADIEEGHTFPRPRAFWPISR
jgi:hypothetical protein